MEIPPTRARPAAPAELLLAASHLSELATSALSHLANECLLVGPGSTAATDRDNSEYDGVWGRGTQMVCLEVGPRLAIAADHARAIAALTTAPGVHVALVSLVRPALDSLATLSWLYEPELDVRERVRRRFNLRLVSLAQEENLAGLVDGTPASFTDATDDIATEAGRHQFRFVAPTTSKRGVVHSGYLDSPVPRDEALITMLAAPARAGLDTGSYMYRRTSAVVHGQAHGLQPFFIAQSNPSLGLVRAELGLPFIWYLALTASVIAALNTTMGRLVAYFGWNSVEWESVSRPAVEQWAMWLKAANDGP